jgi:DNA-binding CsgD family transcriptional regulator
MLTDRQREVLYWTARGMIMKEVALELGIVEGTVKNHLEGVRLKLNAKTTAHAVFLFYGNREVTTA